MAELAHGRQQSGFSGAERTEAVSSENIPGFFARGVNFYKLFWVFIIVSFLGCLVETVFMLLTRGELQNRSGVIYGSFSLVWGLGAVMFTAVLYKYKDRSDRYVFLAGTILGGAYEYACSVFTELVFGTVFWDYSKIPFNLGGRINLLYCFFWGIAAVVWMRVLYPRLSDWIEKIPKKAGETASRFYDIQYPDVGNGAGTIYRTPYRRKESGKCSRRIS